MAYCASSCPSEEEGGLPLACSLDVQSSCRTAEIQDRGCELRCSDLGTDLAVHNAICLITALAVHTASSWVGLKELWPRTQESLDRAYTLITHSHPLMRE